MKFYQHLIINMRGNLIKIILFSLSLTITATFILFSIFSYKAFNNTEIRVRRNLPTIVSIQHTFKQDINTINRKIDFLDNVINPLSKFHGLKSYNYSLSAGVLSKYLRPSASTTVNLPPKGELYVPFNLKGFSQENIFYFEYGDIDLIDGKMFYYYEMISINNQNPVVIISNSFAINNNLSVGDEIQFGVRISNRPSIIGPVDLDKEELHFLTFTIVGIWDFNNQEVFLSDSVYSWIQEVHANRIFVPNWVIEEIIDIIYYYRGEYIINPIQAHFILKDPIYSAEFLEIVQSLMPPPENFDPNGAFSIDLSDRFAQLSHATNSMKEVMINFKIFSFIIGSIILILSIEIFIKMREKEIKIYLLMGMDKIRCIIFITCELLIYSIIAIISSFLFARGLTNHIARLLFKNELTHFYEYSKTMPYSELELTFGLTVPQLSPTELMDYFIVEMSIFQIFVFNIIVIILVVIFTIFSLIPIFNKS